MESITGLSPQDPNGAFPLHGTVRDGSARFGTAQFGSVRCPIRHFSFQKCAMLPQFTLPIHADFKTILWVKQLHFIFFKITFKEREID